MTAIPLILSAMLAWYPTIDGQRQLWDEQDSITAVVPYWLGVSCPPGEIVDLRVNWCKMTLELDNNTGTQWNLLYIDDYCHVDFYESGQFAGTIIPEPATVFLFFIGFLCRKRGGFKKYTK